MEQPPQKTVQDIAKTMHISPAELVHEAKRRESYLSVLPTDIKEIVEKHAYPLDFEQLDLAIAKLKASVDETTKEKLLYDLTYNQKLIDDLSKKFNIYPSEVAFMLDTLASIPLLQVMERSTQHQDIWWTGKTYSNIHKGYEVLLMDIKKYLEPLLKTTSNVQKEANKQIAIKYLNRFINHPRYSEMSRAINMKYGGSYDRNDILYLEFVTIIYSIVYGRSHFSFPDFHGEARGMDQSEAFDLLKRLKVGFELDKGEEWLAKWTQQFVRERFWSLFAKNLMTYMIDRDDKKVNILINVLVANKEKIKEHLRTFLKDQPIRSVKTPTYIELLESFQNYIENTGNYALFDKLKEFLDSESVALIAQNLLIASLSKQTLTSAQLKQFISYGADVHKEIVKEKAQKFITNLTNATISLETLNLLISLGADINKPNQNNEYLLIKAIKSKQPAFVRMVLDAPGVKVDICQDGYSPMWYAQNVDMDTATRTAIIEMLKEKGATQEASCAIQ